MKIIDTCTDKFPIEFTGENTFICGAGVAFQTVASIELGKLKADNNTVLVTDPYLFPNMRNTSDEQAYERNLLRLLMGLKAKKIIFCAKDKKNSSMFRRIETELQKHGVIFG